MARPFKPGWRWRSIASNAVTALASTACVLLIVELGTRAAAREFRFKDFLAEERSLFTAGYPCQYDRELGWVLKEGYRGDNNIWRTMLTVGHDSVRLNGHADFPATGPAILAVGDSFTFGDQVSDDETWPAILEQRLRRSVVNAGVFGYGLDQIYLRAERLVPKLKPQVLIVGLFPDDIDRCQLSRRTAAWKPYFEVAGAALVKRNVPVPRPSQDTDTDWLRHVLGHSLFAHQMMMKHSPGYWLKGLDWWKSTVAHEDGARVACLLLGKFRELAATHGIQRTYFLVQYAADLSGTDRIDEVLGCAFDPSVEIVDLRIPLAALKLSDAAQFESLFIGHMSAKGNDYVARQLQQAMNGS